jgi:hypothetical protein
MSSRPWWLAQLWVGLAMGVIAIAARLALAIGGAAVAEVTTIPLAVTAAFFAPGLALSFGINGLILARRESRYLGLGERAFLTAEFVAVGVILAAGVVAGSDVLGSFAWIASLLGWIAVLLFAPTILLLEIANRRAPTRPPVRRL